MSETEMRDEFPAFWKELITRRRLLRNAAIGGGLIAAGGALSACSADAGGSGGSGSRTLRLSMSASVPDFDPVTGALGHAALGLSSYVYESLYRWDESDEAAAPTPELAAELPRELSPTSYRVSIRPDVTFHDGSPCTAEDVVFSIERIKDPDSTEGFLRPFFDVVTTVKAAGPHEVELELLQPTTLLAERLTLVAVLSKAAVEASADSLAMAPVGTGPYEVTSAVSGQNYDLRKYSGYSGKLEFTFDELKFTVMSDGNARVSSLLAGDTDVVEAVPYGAVRSLEGQERVTVEVVSGDDRTHLFFNCGRPPFDDVRARQAVLFAIDRDAINQAVFSGMADAAWEGHIRPDDKDYVEPSIIYSYDPDRAKQLLADAGMGDQPIPIDFLLPSDVDQLWVQGPIIEENLRAVGFEPNVVPKSANAASPAMAAGEYNCALQNGTTTALSPSAEFYLRVQFYGFLPSGLLHWEGEEMQQLQSILDSVISESDPAVVSRYLAEIQNIVQEQAPTAPLHFMPNVTAWSSTIEGVRPLSITGLSRGIISEARAA